MFRYARWLRQVFGKSARMSRRTAPGRRPSTRPRLEQLEDRVVLTTWTALGPAPIDNGQVAGGNAVSGRITGIAADPKSADTVYLAAAGGGVWKTTNATAATPTWTPLTDNLTDSNGNPVPEFMGAIAETDATSGIYKGNQIVYAGTGEANNSADSFYGEGILVSTNGGTSWSLINANGAFSGRTVSKIVIDPSDSFGATAYAAVGDSGANGTSGNTGIWKTTNFGQNWTNTTEANGLSTTDDWSDVAIDPNTPKTLFAAEGNVFGSAGNGVYKSVNGGSTWTLLTGTNSFNGTQDGRIALAVYDNGNTSELFVSIAQPLSNAKLGGQLYKMLKSTDGGKSFTDLTGSSTPPPNYMGQTSGGVNYGQGWYNTTLIVDPNNPNYVYAGGSDNGDSGGAVGNIESFNGGTSWQSITQDSAGNGPHSDDHAVAFDAAGNLIDGNDGGVFRLNDPTSAGNQTWSDLNTNLQITQFTGIAVDPTVSNVVYGGSQDNGTEKYTGSLGWTQVQGGDGGITRLDPTNHSTLYQEFTGVSLQVSTNAGSSFTPITSGIKANTEDFYVPYVLDSSGDIYYGTDYLNFSSNQGAGWSQIGTPNTNGFNPKDAPIDAVAVSPTNNHVVYVSAGGNLFVTQDAQDGSSATWTKINLPVALPSGFIGAHNNIVVDPADASGGTAYLVVNDFNSSGNRVYRLAGDGAFVTDLSGNLPDVPIWSIAVTPDGKGKDVYVGTDVGVYVRLNGATSWVRFGNGLPNAQVVDLEYVPSLNLLAAGTHGRGTYEIPVGVSDLSVTKTGPAIVTAGADATYTITLTNNGPDDAQNVVLSDALPSGATLVSITPAGTNPDSFTQGGSGSTVTETAATVGDGDSDVFTLVVKAASNLTDGSAFDDTASVTSDTINNSPASDLTSTVNSTIATVADLQVAQTAPASITAGTDATYTLTIVNNGPSDAQGVQLTDVVPTGTTFVSAAPVSGQNPDGFTVSNGAGTVTTSTQTVAAGHSDLFTLVVLVPSSAANGSTISNTATVATTTTDDNDSINDETSTANSTVVVADLSVTKTGPAIVTAGANATYTITLTNSGSAAAQNVVLTDALPTGASLVSITPAGTNPDRFIPGGSGGTATETAATVGKGDTDVFTLVVKAASNLTGGSAFDDTASVTTSTADDSPAGDLTSTVNSTIITVADLQVTQTPASITAGADATYTLTIVNNGPSDAQGVQLTDVVPTGTTFVSAAPVSGQNPDGFTVSNGAGTVTTSTQTVAAGHSDLFTLVVLVPSSAANGSTISNTATVTTTTTDDNDTINDETSTVTSTVAAVADLSVTKTGPATVTAGTDATYTITLTNRGPSGARNVVLTDALPAGASLVSIAPAATNPDSFTPGGSGGTVTETAASVANGNSDVFTLVVKAASNLAKGSSFSDTASVASSTTDKSPAGDLSSTFNSTIATVADLQVAQAAPASITAGTDATYTLTIVNNGPSDAQGVQLTDVVPTGTTFVSAAPVSGQDPDGFTISNVAGTVTTSTQAVAAGHTDLFTLVVQALSSAANGSTISNTATVATTTTDDNDTINDETSTANSTVAAVADLSVNKTGPDIVTAGANATYTITLTNRGPSDAQNVVLSDALPTGASLVSITPAGTNPDSFTQGGSGSTVTETAATVGNGDTDVFTLVVKAASNLTDGSAFDDTASVTTSTTDKGLAGDLSSTFNSAITTVADPEVAQTAPARITAGIDATYTLTIVNNGPSDAQGVQLTDVVPTGTTFVSAAPVSGQDPDGFTISNGADAVATNTQTVVAGHSDLFTLVVQALSGDVNNSTISNTANVTTTEGNKPITVQPSTATSTVVAVADLSVTQAGPAAVTAGANATYTITLTNAGPSDAQHVSLSDALPAGATFVSAAAVAAQNPDGFAYTESAGTVTGTPTGGVVASGHTDVFTVVVTALSSDADGSSLSNTASVSTTTGNDGTANDETSTVTSTVAVVADLSVTQAGPAAVTAGANATYTITLTNTGPSDAQNVSLSDALPAGTTFVSAAAVAAQNPDGFSFVQSAGTITGTPGGGVVAGGHTDVFTVVVTAPASDKSGSTLSNTASVSTTTTDDGTATDETSTATSTVAVVADLSVTQAGPAAVTAGANATYTITLTNTGPSDAQNVSLSDALPAGTTFVSAAAVGAQNPDGFTYTESAGTITGTPTGGVVAAGRKDVFTLVVHIPNSLAAGSTTTNTASVSTTTTDDSSPNDETSTANSTVVAVADLSVTQAGPAAVTAGLNATYTITLVNSGPSDAQHVSLSDALPAGTTFVSAAAVAAQNPDGFAYTESAGTVTGTPTGGVVASGHTDVFTLVVAALSSDADGSTLSNTATVTTTTSDDSSPNDESSTATSSVAAAADLSLTQTGPATVPEGSPITYGITLSNNGPSDAQNVQLTDTLPAGLTLVSTSTSQGTSAASSGAVVFSAGTVRAGTSVVATLVVQTNEEGTFTDTATGSSSTTDPQSGNMTGTVATTVLEAPINLQPVAVNGTEFSSLNNVNVATFTHGNGLDPASAFSATINWGDNTTTTGTVVQSGTTYLVQGTHTYRSDGSYSITVKVVEDGESVSASANPTASIAEAGLPSGALAGPTSEFVNEAFENVYVQQLSALQINLLAVALYDLELSAMAAFIQEGVDPVVAYELSVYLGATEFNFLVQNLANFGTDFDTTAMDLTAILLEESMQPS